MPAAEACPQDAIGATSDVSDTVETPPNTGIAITPRVDDPASPFYNTMWVGLYGTPGGRGLGILGTASPTETVVMAVQQAKAYQALLPGIRIIPFFHMVVTIADAASGARR